MINFKTDNHTAEVNSLYLSIVYQLFVVINKEKKLDLWDLQLPFFKNAVLKMITYSRYVRRLH